MAKRLRFIINPFSGLSKKRNVPALLKKHLRSDFFEYDIVYTERAGHASDLAVEAVEKGYDIVVAVGGDGSVNEVAAGLIGTDTVLGILPGGSGNGFAMHLGLGRVLEKAIPLLHTAQTIRIDTCQLNGRPFVNLAGTGFDALVAYRAKNSSIRGLWAYTKYAILESWSYSMQPYKIRVDGIEVYNKNGLVVEVANAQMFGYNFVIAPQAKLDDGLLDVLVVKESPKWRYLFSLWRFFNNSFDKSSLVQTFSGKQIEIETTDAMPVHVDGEGFYLDNKLNFTILPQSLKVLVPNNSPVLS